MANDRSNSMKSGGQKELLRKTHGEWSDVVAVNLQDRGLPSGIGGIICRRECSFLARKQGEIVVVPENRHKVFPALPFCEAQMDLKSHAGAGIFHFQADRAVIAILLHGRSQLESDLGLRI